MSKLLKLDGQKKILDGVIAGYLIRKYLANNGPGYLFTGGVEGVGLDAYLGAAMYAKENKESSRFFALIPEFTIVPTYTDDDACGGQGRKRDVRSQGVRGGDRGRPGSIEQRRGDARRGGDRHRDGTPIIVVENSGGAAKDIADRKNGRFVLEIKEKWGKFSKCVVPHRLEDKTLDMNMVNIAFDEWDITKNLLHVLKTK